MEIFASKTVVQNGEIFLFALSYFEDEEPRFRITLINLTKNEVLASSKIENYLFEVKDC